MEKVIKIGEKEVKFKATAGTLTRYRMYFNGSDFLKDIIKLSKKLERVKGNSELEQFEAIDLEIFERIAWTMAKTADDTVPSIEHWLDDFDTFSIMQILPEIMELVVANMQQTSENKKKLEQIAGN